MEEYTLADLCGTYEFEKKNVKHITEYQDGSFHIQVDKEHDNKGEIATEKAVYTKSKYKRDYEAIRRMRQQKGFNQYMKQSIATNYGIQ
ncbi:hypothetical protein ACM65P_002635 [Vibrio alginolyticus]